MKIDDMERVLTEPSHYFTSGHPDNAILRLNVPYGFIEYPRAELKEVMIELKQRIRIIEAGIEKPTASDRLLLEVLMAFCGESPNFKE